MIASCTVRAATSEDSAAILACLRAAFEPFRNAYTPDAFTDTILTPEALADRFTMMTILVATAPDGSIVGTIAASAEHNEGHLRGMAVRDAWQGRGVALQLLTTAELHLQARGCRRVTLDTTAPLTRAIAFYARHGYAPTGRTQDFYGMSLYEYAKVLS